MLQMDGQFMDYNCRTVSYIAVKTPTSMQAISKRKVASVDNTSHNKHNTRVTAVKTSRLTLLQSSGREELRKIYAVPGVDDKYRQKEKPVKNVARNQVSCQQGYYFVRRGNKGRAGHAAGMDGGTLTERKSDVGCGGASVSLRRERKQPQSYRVNTIDYVEEEREDNKQSRQIKYESITMVKSAIDNRNSGRLVKALSACKQQTQQDDSNKPEAKSSRRNVEINFHHRKYTKIRTQAEQSNRKQPQQLPQQAKTIEFLCSERNSSATLIDKDPFANRNTVNLVDKSQKCTLELKIPRRSHKRKLLLSEHEGSGNKLGCGNFSKYMDYVGSHRKLEINRNSKRTISNLGDRRSVTIEPQQHLPEQDCMKKIPRAKPSITIDCNLQKITKSYKKLSVVNNSEQKQNCYIKSSQKYLQLDCSSIAEINQSSFLSDSAKKQLLLPSPFTLCDSQNNYQNQSKILVKKKKKRKEAKLSIICRSEMKQAFPQRFFL